jgi:hypothetical protein
VPRPANLARNISYKSYCLHSMHNIVTRAALSQYFWGPSATSADDEKEDAEEGAARRKPPKFGAASRKSVTASCKAIAKKASERNVKVEHAHPASPRFGIATVRLGASASSSQRVKGSLYYFLTLPCQTESLKYHPSTCKRVIPVGG